MFEALTGPKLVKCLALASRLVDPRVPRSISKVGGALRFEWRNDDGRELGMSGVYREINHADANRMRN